MDQVPDPCTYGVVPIIVLVVLLVLMALFEAARTAVEECSRNKIKALAADGNRKAQYLMTMLENSGRFASASLTFMIFAGALTSAGVTVYIAKTISEVVIYTAVLAFAIICLCVILPKKIALIHPEGVALGLATGLNRVAIIVKPFVFIADGLAKIILKILHQEIQEDEEFSEDEVMDMLEDGQESGALKEESKKMINSIFEFDDKLAYEIMTPRTDVFAIDLQDPVTSYLDELMEMKYTRIPVYDEDTDNIIGILNIKDFFAAAKDCGFENVDIRPILRKPYFVPETKNIDSLFVNLQSSKNQIAILIDEFGGFSGIVTLEDIIEEVMGDIEDEYDEQELQVEQIDEHSYLVDGSADLDDLNEQFGTEFKSDNSETIGGLVLDILGEIPEDGDDLNIELEAFDCTITIKKVSERRIDKVLITK